MQQAAGQIPVWQVATIARLKDPKLREWYIWAYIENGGSVVVFPDSMKGGLQSVEQLVDELMAVEKIGHGN